MDKLLSIPKQLIAINPPINERKGCHLLKLGWADRPFLSSFWLNLIKENKRLFINIQSKSTNQSRFPFFCFMTL